MEKMRFGRVQAVETPPSVEGRVPPHDLDAEAAVLSAIMIDGAALDKVLEFLKAEHFYSEAHRRIYEACIELRQVGSASQWLAQAVDQLAYARPRFVDVAAA